MAAQELAIAARGYPSGSNGHRWTMNSGGSASTDDITVSASWRLTLFSNPLTEGMAPLMKKKCD
ncbi:hypothetical protein TELCIR_15965 [Teladorsagia circumcincta]|uniref:Uncharacterized protein n=1 Tax=Teladorsagia circumcincta TaxID=45464 RepID=A0A2G9TWT1_TELCI|nr:hypothetical protein TELCIR_15965 [Teladorsagia circumcincta]